MADIKVITKKCLTGLEGLDSLLGGGLPERKSILVIGGPGCGKTILLSQFIYNGVKKFNEPGIFITLLESVENIKQNMLNFGWNFTELEEQGKIAFIDLSPIIYLSPEEFNRTVFGLKVPEFTVDTISASVQKIVEKVKAKRIVIDSINSLSIHDMEPTKKRRDISSLFQGILKTQCTCLLTSEIRATTLERMFQVEEYLADGVIILKKIVKDNKMGRLIQVDKMRGIAHDTEARPYKITNKGIAIYAQEKSF